MSLKLEGTGLNGNNTVQDGGILIRILMAVLELPAKQPIWPIFLVDRLNWQCCLAGSSKTAPGILIFLMAMDTNYTFELNSIKTCAPQFK